MLVWDHLWGRIRVVCHQLLLHYLVCQCLDLRRISIQPQLLHSALEHSLANTHGSPFPLRHPHPHAWHHVLSEIFYPHVHDFWVSIPSLDGSFVYTAFEVFLTFLVNKGSPDNGPHRALRREVYRPRSGYAECTGCVFRKVREQVQKGWMMRAEVEGCNRNVVWAWKGRRRIYGASSDHH